jgi:hypothetical protein
VVFSKFRGVTGLFLAFPASDLVGIILSGVILTREIREIKANPGP